MIPSITRTSPIEAHYLAFLDALRNKGFEGDIAPDYANRTVMATDNSIYQRMPQGVIYPRHIGDLEHLAALASRPDYREIVLSPRGGGTGTNGQSLTDGLLVDVSRYMNAILEINVEEGWARVESGVVKDQLNAALRPHGLFFAPELSTSNRATIGGMISTDASGQGSCLYGKTRDHLLELRTVLLDGNIVHSQALTEDEFNAQCQRQDRVGLVHRLLNSINIEQGALIEEKFPKLNRCLTGYDLAHIRDQDGRFNLNNILCGSEGSLGFVAEAKLRVLPIPKAVALVVVNYSDFDSALRDAGRLMQAGPTSIETVDSKVLNLARNDIVWQDVAPFFMDEGTTPVEGVNLVEYTADNEQDLHLAVERLLSELAENGNSKCLGQAVAWGRRDVNRVWGMRKKAVGLLGNTSGEARPVPFVEDTAVPPENLADFILEFRQLLDSHNLSYGMFGHVDAGVLHVRPALDMKDPQQEQMVRLISDQVADLCHKYGGLLWGEHGKGVRSEYAPKFFGELYPQLQRVKAAFDPHNQLNPGKIATPDADSSLLKIDAVPTRGQTDRKIPVQVWEGYSEAVYCNGNGVCFNWDYADPMCPSWKVTRKRTHSPKGRASLVREWLTQLEERGCNPEEEIAGMGGIRQGLSQLPRRIKNTWAKRRGDYDFSHEINDSMEGCLACKACAGQCPVKVDVPSFRSKFLALYYQRYLRPAKHYLVGSLEFTLPLVSQFPRLYNGIMAVRPVRWIFSRWIGFEDAPPLTGIKLAKALAAQDVKVATERSLGALTDSERRRTVVLVQDAFTSYFDTRVVVDFARLLKALGFNPMLAPYRANGKPLHVHGFLQEFRGVAAKNARHLKAIADAGVALVGIDPSMTLTYRSEYAKTLKTGVPEVLLIQEWLAERLDQLESHATAFTPGRFKLMPHCTEKTNAAGSMQAWKQVFESLGQQLEVVDLGCCGMAGTYGHETVNRSHSAELFEMSWAGPVGAKDNQGILMATGYSCRSQTRREAGVELPHPLQVLLAQWQGRDTPNEANSPTLSSGTTEGTSHRRSA